MEAVTSAIGTPGVKVLISRQECALTVGRRQPPERIFQIDPEKCTFCRSCLRETGCPALAVRAYGEGEKMSIDPELCTGCGQCVENCPVEVPSEFDQGLSTRRAIYRSFPQAVPNAFVIDKVGIAPCQAACPAGQHAQGYISYIREGRFEEALAVATRLEKDIPDAPAANLLRGDVFQAQGRMEDARRCFEEALAIQRGAGDRRAEGPVLVLDENDEPGGLRLRVRERLR